MTKVFAALQMYGGLGEERRTDGVFAAAHVHRINTQGAQNVPCGHLAVVLVADIALAKIAAHIGARQHFTDNFLCAVGRPA